MKKSTRSESHISMEKELDLLLQITENVWVQCDNANCQKWRKVPKEAAASYGPGVSWYCSLNPDSMANDCSKPEENHAEYEKMAMKAGIKFILSELEMGELVWAKTAGYCRWPGVITKDPENGLHVNLDVDGDPVAYHIEYLGNPHTHCWVYAHLTETYGHRYKTLMKSLKKEAPSNMGGKIRHKKAKKKNMTEKLKESNEQFMLKEAIEEAEDLLELSKLSRLSLMVFQYDPGERRYQAAQPAGKEESCSKATWKMPCKKKKSRKGCKRKSKNFSKANYVKNFSMEKRDESMTNLLSAENIHNQKPKSTCVKVKHCQHHTGLTDVKLPKDSSYLGIAADNELPFMEYEELGTEVRTCVKSEDPLMKDSIYITNEFDAMMREIEEDIQSLSSQSQDSNEEETTFTLDDLELDLSAMEGYFGHV